MYKYRLVQMKNSIDKTKPKKWYAVSVSKSSLTPRQTMRMATDNTTISDVELEAALELLMRHTALQLRQGQRVRIGDFGSFRVTFRSEGVDEVEQFNANGMIRNPRIVFKPSAEFRKRVLQNLTFQNDGVLENGVCYGSLADYRRAKEAMKGQAE